MLITDESKLSSAWRSHVLVITTVWLRQGWTCGHCGGCHDGVAGIGNAKDFMPGFVGALMLLQTALMFLEVPSIAMTSAGVWSAR